MSPADNDNSNEETDPVPALMVNSTSKNYHLRRSVNGIGMSAQFLVDTRAAVSILSKNVWDKVTALHGEIKLEEGD